MIWAGYNGSSQNGNPEVTEVHEGFFVGTEEEYKEFGAGKGIIDPIKRSVNQERVKEPQLANNGQTKWDRPKRAKRVS